MSSQQTAVCGGRDLKESARHTVGIYLSSTEVAERIGVAPDTLGRYKLPEPDALIGTTRGWLPATIDAWNASRPGRLASAAVDPGSNHPSPLLIARHCS